MSLSVFHQHFKTVTGLSPLQYQKRLCLQEARRLMMGEGLDAVEAAFRVGYESPSQLSREYRRLFGAPARRTWPRSKSKLSQRRNPGFTSARQFAGEVLRASVRLTSAGTALPPICCGLIDRGIRRHLRCRDACGFHPDDLAIRQVVWRRSRPIP